jgi:hypothetical protein
MNTLRTLEARIRKPEEKIRNEDFEKVSGSNGQPVNHYSRYHNVALDLTAVNKMADRPEGYFKN